MDPWILPHAALAFFALAMAILSVWVKPSPWIWGSFLILACGLAYLAKIITPIALLPIGGLLVLHAFLKGEIYGFARFILVLITVALSVALMSHFLPGFNNWQILNKVKISSDAYPYSLYLNFNKPFIGIFVLALGFPLARNLKELSRVMKTAIPLTIGGIILMILLAVWSGLIKWDPKFPKIVWFFAVENLIFVCIIEEAFWRGFVQNEFFRWFKRWGFFAHIACIVATAFLFAALHYFWVPSIPFLTLVFAAGIIYGSIYQYTRALEASIFCHFAFNLTHFLLFTYPVLQSAISIPK